MGGSFRVARGGPVAITAHPDELITVSNPRLGQAPPGREGPAIGKVENNFNVMNPDPLMLERATNKYLIRLGMR
jgi:hypothetical protein